MSGDFLFYYPSVLYNPMGENRELRISKNYRQNFMAAFYSM